MRSQPLSPTLTHSQPLSPTPTHFSRKTTPSHPFFDKNDPLPPIFQEKRPTSTHFLIKTYPSQPFLMEKDELPPMFNKNNPIPTIFQQIRPSPTYFSTKTTHPYHSHPFLHQSTTNAICIQQFSNYNRPSLPVTINALNGLSLENMIFEYSMSEENRRAYFSKNQIYLSILLYMKYGRQYVT